MCYVTLISGDETETDVVADNQSENSIPIALQYS